MKLCCLLLYFLALFVLARVFEAVAWYESGFLATQLVDPVALSFRKLRTILECRGLGYSGLPEKKDVRELVEKSGTRRFSPPPPTRGEGGVVGGRSPVSPGALGLENRAPLPTPAGQRRANVGRKLVPPTPRAFLHVTAPASRPLGRGEARGWRR